MKKRLALLTIPFLLTSPQWISGQPKPALPEVQLTHRARSLQPGEVVLMNARCSVELEKVEAHGFDREILFYSTQDASVWQGLVGIDLETVPGEYVLKVHSTTKGGAVVEAGYRLRVEGKDFPVRRLTVADEFVTPPKQTLARIGRESKRVSAIFQAVSEEKLWKGSFLRPVPGKATSSFGKRNILNGQVRSPHSGTDFRAGQGTPVTAPNVGKVVLAAELYFSGKTVILDHGLGLYSYLAHLSRLAVQEGDTVSPGSLVGYVGATGRVTGPHLHWSIRMAEARVDPLSLMTLLN